MVKKFDKNLPNPPTIAQINIIFGSVKFNPAIIILAAANESPKMRILLGVGEKYGFNFTLVLCLVSMICVY